MIYKEYGFDLFRKFEIGNGTTQYQLKKCNTKDYLLVTWGTTGSASYTTAEISKNFQINSWHYVEEKAIWLKRMAEQNIICKYCII